MLVFSQSHGEKIWVLFYHFIIPKLHHNFLDASWNETSNKTGLGFIIIANPSVILHAGSLGSLIDSPNKVEIAAINLVLQACINHGWSLNKIYCDCPGVAQMLQNYTPSIAWRFYVEVETLKHNLNLFPNIVVPSIAHEKNNIANALAAHG